MSARTAAITTVGSPSSSSPSRPAPTTLPAEAVTDPGSPQPRPNAKGVRVAVDAMGGDHGISEVVPGALDYARQHPADQLILVGDDSAVRAVGGAPLPDNVSIVQA